MRFGDYELVRELGRGATARVHLAREVATGREVCLKIFHPRLFGDSRFESRIEREMDVSAQLQHPSIVKVRKVLKDSDPPAIVMDYIDGDNLEAFQRRLPYVLPEVSVRIVIRLLEALECAHTAGVIHRDLKPENVLIGRDGQVAVTDFGLAKLLDSATLTQSNVILGTLDYLSPEQARGDVVGPLSDLFSVGGILYFLTTGTRPFSRATPLATLAAIQNERPEPAQRRNPKLSGELSRILERAMAKEPADRFASARAFRDALESYLGGLGLFPAVFDLPQWMQEPAQVTLEALKISAEELTHACEAALRDGAQDVFLERLAHLSLKAPESPALMRLTELYQVTRKRLARRRIYAGVAALLLLVVVAIGTWRFSPPSQRFGATGPARPEAVATQNVPTVHPPSQSFGAAGAPSPTRAPAVLPTRKAKTARRGTVLFDLDPEIQVFWNGRKVDPTAPLHQPVGEHLVLLERPGFDPIRAKVTVKEGEPTRIRVKDEPNAEGRRR